MLEKKGKEIESQMLNTINNYKRSLAEKKAQLDRAENAVKAAKGFGDLSENTEYVNARNLASRLIVEIITLQDTIDTYDKYAAKYTPTGKVQIGSVVKLLDVGLDTVRYVKVYPPGLGNAKIGALAANSPVGIAILGKSSGTTIEVQAPIGTLLYSIQEVL